MSPNINHSRWGYILLTPHLQPPATPQRVASLSLTATAHLSGPGAKVTILQRFDVAGVDSSEATEATYVFPLPDGGAVCEFECLLDGRVVVGVVREKGEARREYREAVEEGRRAVLFEQHCSDVFQVSLGNTQKSKSITTKITYVQELSHNVDDDEIRFSLLSKTLKERYGDPISISTLPNTFSTSLVHDPSDSKSPVSITLEMPAPILSLQSPSHGSMVVGMGRCGAVGEMVEFDARKARIELDAEGAYPDRELVVVAKVKDLNKPSCMVERHPVHGTHAVALTMVPRFALNEIRTEIVVLVDRSGSMEGRKIKQASAALQVLLKSIPPGTFFNIIGFGSTHQPLFPSSKEYTSQTLQTAEKHCKNLKADLGGTEIQSAIEFALKTRRRDMPTQVFVLTDGEVWNVEALLESLRRRVEEAEKTPEAFVRLFSLGIGNDVSHHLVEGMSRVGGGFAQFVGEEEKLKAKVVKMLKAAVLPPIVGYKIDWTDGCEVRVDQDEGFEMVAAGKEGGKKPTLSFFSSDEKPKAVAIDARKIPAVQQAPFKVPNLWPGMRFHAYAILDATVPPPTQVTITATSTDGPLKLVIPVIPASQGTLLHTLAARKLIQDIDDGTSHLATSFKVVGPVPSALAKEEMVRLGKTFGIVSKHTSFLAVEKGGVEVVDGGEETPTLQSELLSTQPTPLSSVASRLGAYPAPPPYPCSPSAPIAPSASFSLQSSSMCAPQSIPTPKPCMSAPPPPRHRSMKKGGMAFRSSVRRDAPGSMVGAAVEAEEECDRMMCEGDGGASMEVVCEQKKVARKSSSSSFISSIAASFGGVMKSKAVKQSLDTSGEGSIVSPSLVHRRESSATLTNDDSDHLCQTLISLQSFNGSFPISSLVTFLASLSGISKTIVKDLAKEFGMGEEVVAVAVAVAVFRGRFGELEDEWEMVVGKAVRFGSGVVGEGAWERVLEKASEGVKA
ncbi:hypothetical protein HDU67_003015 [Dinochytrium kinnereticum]|nr:hypothetical protein HDU67_003015 [Dinochytrium kinnereticum]